MNSLVFKLLLVALVALAEGSRFSGHAHRGQAQRAGRFAFRQGRQNEEALQPPLAAYGQQGPADSGAALDAPAAADVNGGDFGSDFGGDFGGDRAAEAGYTGDEEEQEGETYDDSLTSSVPGVAGEDYPVLAEVPESEFSCEGQIDGGYYADPAADCQVFHICTSDGFGGLTKYSFLCPNGTIFNQEYFICDWWFNFDCSNAEDLYTRNDDVKAERDEVDNAAAASDYNDAAASDYNDDAARAADNGQGFQAASSYRAAINGFGPQNHGGDAFGNAFKNGNNGNNGFDQGNNGFDNGNNGFDQGNNGFDHGNNGFDNAFKNGNNGFDQSNNGFDQGNNGFDNAFKNGNNGNNGFDNGNNGFDQGNNGFDNAFKNGNNGFEEVAASDLPEVEESSEVAAEAEAPLGTYGVEQDRSGRQFRRQGRRQGRRLGRRFHN